MNRHQRRAAAQRSAVQRTLRLVRHARTAAPLPCGGCGSIEEPIVIVVYETGEYGCVLCEPCFRAPDKRRLVAEIKANKGKGWVVDGAALRLVPGGEGA